MIDYFHNSAFNTEFYDPWNSLRFHITETAKFICLYLGCMLGSANVFQRMKKNECM
jgi:hypothetical protein